jgi:hypothetical protein
MKLLKLFLMLLLASSLLSTCKEDGDEFKKEPDPIEDPKDTTATKTYNTAKIQVKLPDAVNHNINNATLVSLGSESKLDVNLNATIPFNPGIIELAYLVDSEDELLMAGFLTNERKEITVATTAEVMLYFGMFSSLNTITYKRYFVENIASTQAFKDLNTEFEALFKSNKKVFFEGGYTSALNKAILALSERDTVDLSLKRADIRGIKSSGLDLNDIGEKSFTVTNYYPRRTHGFIYKKSYKDQTGNETVINSMVDGNDISDKELKIPYIRLADEREDNLQNQVFNFNLCSQGAQYLAKTSDELNLELADGRLSETYEVAIIGPGSGIPAERPLTNKENEKLEQLSIETFVMDYFVPIILDIGGNKDIYSSATLQQADAIIPVVEPILRAHSPSIKAVIENNFATAIDEFLPFLYGDIRLSNDLRNIMTQLYGIISKGSSPNTFIQNNELIQQGESRYLKLTSAIVRSMKESVGIACVNSRLESSSKLTKWDITIYDGLVKLKPEKMVTVPFGEPKDIYARTFIDLATGESLEYEWSTTSQFGGILNDYNGQDATQFTSKSEKVAFFSNASNLNLGDGDNIEKVTVKVYVVKGTSRDQLGTATMEVNVKKKKFEIKPNGITIDGKTRLKLYLSHGDGTTAIPNNETDYKIEWSTSGTYGLFNGLTTSQTVENENSITYVAEDTEVESGTETFQVQIYSRPKNSDEPYTLADQAKASIKIENDENKKIFFVSLTPVSWKTEGKVYTNCGAYAVFLINPVENAVRYEAKIIEFSGMKQSPVGTTKSWSPSKKLNEDGQYEFSKISAGASSAPHHIFDHSNCAKLFSNASSLSGVAQVTVTLKSE